MTGFEVRSRFAVLPLLEMPPYAAAEPCADGDGWVSLTPAPP